MYIKSTFKGVVVKNSRFIAAVCVSAVLSIFTFPALASTISGAQVNLNIGYVSSWDELVLVTNAGFTSISSEVEYPEYWVASHDIDEISPGSGVITFQTDNDPLASQAQFSESPDFSGFVYEFPSLDIISASLSSTNQPDVFSDSRIVLLSPTLIGIDVSGLAWGYYDLEPLIISVDFQTAVPIPAAAWLFGSGLIGLIGLARRKM